MIGGFTCTCRKGYYYLPKVGGCTGKSLHYLFIYRDVLLEIVHKSRDLNADVSGASTAAAASS